MILSMTASSEPARGPRCLLRVVLLAVVQSYDHGAGCVRCGARGAQALRLVLVPAAGADRSGIDVMTLIVIVVFCAPPG